MIAKCFCGVWLAWLVGVVVRAESAPIKVPHTESPDGRVALYFEKAGERPDQYQFYFRRQRSLVPAGAGLSRSTAGKVLGREASVNDDFDTALLLDSIAWDVVAKATGEQRDPAFSYSVTWSPDGRYVVVEGGEHRFWQLALYRVEPRSNRRVPTWNWDFGDYYHARLPRPKLLRLGAGQKIKALPFEGIEPAYACWIRSGLLAVDSYPYLMGEENSPSNWSNAANVYFLIDFRRNRRGVPVGFTE